MPCLSFLSDENATREAAQYSVVAEPLRSSKDIPLRFSKTPSLSSHLSE